MQNLEYRGTYERTRLSSTRCSITATQTRMAKRAADQAKDRKRLEGLVTRERNLQQETT